MPPVNRLMAPPALQAYQPTLRDRVANKLLSLLGDGYEQQRFVENLLGSSGLGRTKTGAADFIPVLGQALQADEAGRQIAAGHPCAGGANLLMAALPVPAAAKGVKAVANKLLPEAVQAAERAAPQIVAYHGSPHTFDAFDASKIGTGEGAQAYGHGLYFAENEGVARDYQRKLANAVSDTPTAQGAAMRALSLEGSPEAAIASLNGQLRHLDSARQAMTAKGRHDIAANYENTMGTYRDALDLVRSGRVDPNGAMYQVGINAHPDHFLDWDAPLSEQHPAVKQALEPLLDPMAKAYGSGPLTTQSVGDIYRRIESRTGAPVAAQQLSDAGIPGIKYLDAGSRGAGDGTRNYVVFDPKNIDILKRYGIPATVLGAGGAAGLALNQQPAASQPAL